MNGGLKEQQIQFFRVKYLMYKKSYWAGQREECSYESKERLQRIRITRGTDLNELMEFSSERQKKMPVGLGRKQESHNESGFGKPSQCGATMAKNALQSMKITFAFLYRVNEAER